jgi:T5SS/PEP-CTERM-associated repeat protein/autotransporter-associated beta strand protein
MSVSKRITASRRCFAADAIIAGRCCHRRSRRADFLATVSVSALFAAVLTPDPAAAATINWLGTINSDWTVNGNWNTGAAPGSTDLATINTTSPNPTVVGVASPVNVTVNAVSTGFLTSGAGSLTIQNGSTFTATTVNVANGTGSTSTVDVTGTGTNLTAVTLSVGTRGLGTMTVENGATATLSSTGNALSVSNGTLNITSGATFNVNGALSPATFVGANNVTGAVNVESGGTFTTRGTITIGNLAGSSGAVTVTGAGSQLTAADLFSVGQAGTGTLTIGTGGTVTVNAQSRVSVASQAGSSGTVNFTGGTLATAALAAGSGTAQVNFNGGTLQALRDNPSFITGFSGTGLNIQAGGATIDTGAFNVGTDSTSAFSGVGALTKTGSGTLTLLGANTFSGGMTVDAGTASASSAGTAFGTGLLTVNVGATADLNNFDTATGGLAGAGSVTLGSRMLTLNQNADTTFSGDVSGTGGLTKNGSGTLDLTGTNSYTGATNIDAGTLRVDGSIASSTVTVNSGGTLAGTGTVDPVVVTINSGGTFAPGNGTPGSSMTIAGNLTFTPGSHYVVSVSGSSASFANVTGTATLTGGTVDAFVTLATTDQQHLILQSNGRSTTFSGVVVEDPNFMGQLVYIGNNVYLVLKADLGGNGGTGGGGTGGGGSSLSGDDARVAGAIDNFFNSGGKLPLDFAVLFEVTGSALANDLSELDGEAATGAERAAFQLTNQFLNVMLDPFVYGRSGGGSGAIGFAPEQQDNLPPDVARAYASILKAPAPATFDQRWTAWGGMSTRQAAARFAIGIATAGTWARL